MACTQSSSSAVSYYSVITNVKCYCYNLVAQSIEFPLHHVTLLSLSNLLTSSKLSKGYDTISEVILCVLEVLVVLDIDS